MITKFDSLFAGHADIENIGYGGTPVNDRLLRQRPAVTALQKPRTSPRRMDRLGYAHVLDGRTPFPARRHRSASPTC